MSNKPYTIHYTDMFGNGPYRREFETEEDMNAWIENSQPYTATLEAEATEARAETLEERYPREAATIVQESSQTSTTEITAYSEDDSERKDEIGEPYSD